MSTLAKIACTKCGCNKEINLAKFDGFDELLKEFEELSKGEYVKIPGVVEYKICWEEGMECSSNEIEAMIDVKALKQARLKFNKKIKAFEQKLIKFAKRHGLEPQTVWDIII
jgi:hypothetical protein